MRGQPVWLASISSSDKKGIIATGDYSEEMMRECQGILEKLLDGVGDPARKRCFRMNVTVCIHKAALPSELASCPVRWADQPPMGIAGPPVEILWETVPASDSCLPCASPHKMLFDKNRPDLWIPRECGQCVSCLARAAV